MVVILLDVVGSCGCQQSTTEWTVPLVVVRRITSGTPLSFIGLVTCILKQEAMLLSTQTVELMFEVILVAVLVVV